MKKKKRMAGLLLFAVLLIALTASVQAASQKSKAIKAYDRFLSGRYIDWESKKVETKDCSFALVYVDKDNVPELLVWGGGRNVYHAVGYGRLYGYKNGKVKMLGKLRDGFQYYKKKGVYVAIGHLRGEIKSYQKISGSSSKQVVGKFTNTKTSYYANGKSISKSTFNKKLKKLVGNKKPSYAKSYKNTAANRKKYLK